MFFFFFYSLKSVSFRRKYFKSGRKVCKVLDKHLITVGPANVLAQQLWRLEISRWNDTWLKFAKSGSFSWVSWTFKGFMEKWQNDTFRIEWSMGTIHAPFVPDNIGIENSRQLHDLNSYVACFFAPKSDHIWMVSFDSRRSFLFPKRSRNGVLARIIGILKSLNILPFLLHFPSFIIVVLTRAFAVFCSISFA